jgi:hypothetical protein
MCHECTFSGTLIAKLATIDTKLDAIKERVDKTNGTVIRHDRWIEGREPVCQMQADTLETLTTEMQQVRTYIDGQRGGMKVAHVAIGAIGGLAVAVGTALLQHWLK